MTVVLNKQLQSVYEFQEEIHEVKFSLCKTTDNRLKLTNSYLNLSPYTVTSDKNYDISELERRFKIILIYDFLSILVTSNLGIFTFKYLEYKIKEDLKKYLECDICKIDEVIYHPLNYIFVKDYFNDHSMTPPREVDALMYINDQTNVKSIVSVIINNVKYHNIANILLSMKIDNNVLNYLIVYCQEYGVDNNKCIVKILRVKNEDYLKHKELLSQHTEYQFENVDEMINCDYASEN